MDIKSMMEQASRLKTDMEKMQKEFETKEFEGTAGGGMVKAIINGKGKILKIKIDPKLISKAGDEEEMKIVEDLIIAATNQAREHLEEENTDRLSSMAGSGTLPDWFK